MLAEGEVVGRQSRRVPEGGKGIRSGHRAPRGRQTGRTPIDPICLVGFQQQAQINKNLSDRTSGWRWKSAGAPEQRGLRMRLARCSIFGQAGEYRSNPTTLAK
ncbi:hypothetical protein FRUB_02905 [Fimbriiglobus ruber]|uniref:Uncharacterized protein n=1 Tax=Fimbriiglobus ruber TaxID=1908690 RepID=A0A225DZW3_9BACT|nr:hypothetical protein FRUB_02905 [Fimbriiglobus ruber]